MIVSEFEIDLKIGHSSFIVPLSPVLITSVLSTRYPSNCQCKSPVIILQSHSYRLDLNLGSNLDFPGPFSVHRPLALLPGPQYLLDFAFSLCSDASFNVSYVIFFMILPFLHTDHSFCVERDASQSLVFVEDGLIYSTPTCLTQPTVLTRENLGYDRPDPRETMRMRWADSRFAILGWVPVAPRFDRPLHALQSPGNTYQIVETKSGWMIADHIVKRLQLLENNLCYLADTLAVKTDILIPIECEDFPRPSAYGYSRTHKTHKGAHISAIQSRDAFFPLVA